jgi:hypothetical protein
MSDDAAMIGMLRDRLGRVRDLIRDSRPDRAFELAEWTLDETDAALVEYLAELVELYRSPPERQINHEK